MIALALFASLSATPATLGALIAKPHPADTITLAPGDYGDRVIRYGEAHITGPKTAVFHSLSVQAGGSGSTLSGFSITMTPTEKTIAFTPALKIAGSAANQVKNITVTGVKVTCGAAVTGIPTDADPHLQATRLAWRAAGGNVLGLPTGVGVVVTQADAVTLTGLDVGQCHKGVEFTRTANSSLTGSEIHDLRTVPLGGGSNINLRIEGNYLHDSNPWNPWNDGTADHSDEIHFTTEAGAQPVSGLVIRKNLIDQGKGSVSLGIYLDDNGHKLGFPGVVIDGNVLLFNGNQGMRLEFAKGMSVTNNKMLLSGPGIAPSIILAHESDGTITGNTAADAGKVFATHPGNTTTKAVQTPAQLAAARAALRPPVKPADR